MWLFWACVGSAMCCKYTEQRSTPIVAAVGSSVVLPCTSKSKPDSRPRFKIYWQITVSGGNILVVDYADEEVKEVPEQDPRYRSRTKFFRSQFKDGNFSLLLSDVRLDDEACYECWILLGDKGSPIISQEGLIDLQPSAKYNEPVLHPREGPSNNSRTITCTATGGYPEADVHWTIDGEPVAKDSGRVQKTPSKQAANGTYNVSSSLTAKASERVECIIENKRLKENRTASIMGAQIGTSRSTSNCELALPDGYVAFIYLLVQWIFWKI
ncbi:CD276 antigen homolog isoform X2 [Lissotriton helveticus]